MIGSRRKASGFAAGSAHGLVAVHLRHHDVHQHDAISGWISTSAIASLPVVAVSTFMPRAPARC
jgi:hypothetical protein